MNEDPAKSYYTITEVAARFKVRESQLRYYEKEFPMLQIKRSRAGDRMFTPADIALLDRIFDLVKTKGLKLDAARAALAAQPAQQSERQQMLAKLLEIKAFLEEIKASLP